MSGYENDQVVYARNDIHFEPLVSNIYAWLHLISPAPSALHFAKFYIPLLESFLAAPDRHRESARDPRLKGGKFVDLPVDEEASAKALLAELTCSPGPTDLAAAVDEVGNHLEATADGHDLSGLYAQVPRPLRGMLEFVYDLHDHARVRYHERTLYRSSWATTERQAVCLKPASEDHRPFAMTTPRLPGGAGFHHQRPLADPVWDQLMRSGHEGARYGAIRDAFAVTAAQEADFDSLLSPVPRLAPDRNYGGDDVRVRYFGHASVLVEHHGRSVLVDPFIAELPDASRFSHADLPDRLDLVLITHGHQDHLELGNLLRLRSRIGRIVVPKTNSGALQDPSLKLCLQSLGFQDVVDVEAGDELSFGSGTVLVCNFIGEHCDLDIAAKVTYAVRAGGRAVYLGADNRGLDAAAFSAMRKDIGAVDLVFLGMECDGAPLNWLYGPLFSRALDPAKRRSRKLNGSDAQEALNIVRGLRARQAAVYAMGREPYLNFVMATNYTEDSYQLRQVAQFLDACGQMGVHSLDLLHKHEFMLPAGGPG